MRSSKIWKKCLSIVTVSLTGIGLAIGLDMAVGGSVYHPLTHLYKIGSWLSCKNSTADNCNKNIVPLISGKNGIVVTTQHNASEIGLQILQQGGNAIDAAVAVGYALAVSDPCCGNIGGGGFMLIHLANGKDTLINFREKAPLKATKDMYLDQQGKVSGLSKKGYLAVAVPGTVRGLTRALSEYGTMTRQQVMNPAIKLASSGFVLQPGDIYILKAGTNKFKEQPNVKSIFLQNGDKPYLAGNRLVQKNLAQTLQQISTHGADAFYKGAIAQEIVKASSEHGGILTPFDFTSYTATEIQPVRCSYRGYEVISAPPPGGGTTLCQMLNILEGYQIKQLGWHSKDSLHLMLSSMLYAYADRNKYLGDPDFVKNPVERLISKDYAASIRSQIPQDRAIAPQPLYSGITTSSEGTNTTHYSIQDRYGNAVAVTYTLNGYFGTGVIAGNTGFFLNNEMDDFTSKPGAANGFGLVQGNANTIASGKRPLSSMSPTIVTKNGKVFLITGTPGGSTITTTVLQVITNVIDYDKNIAEAVNAPRFHYQGLPNVVLTEPYTLGSADFQRLWGMGYRVAPFLTWGAAESIFTDPKTGLLYGANDSRKPAGLAIAY